MATILVVDDETSYRELLRIGLDRAGHTVFTAPDGRSAVELGLRVHPDIVISDWMLKDSVDGLMVADALRIVDPELQIIFLTSFTTADQKLQSKHQHNLHVVEKPFELDELLHIIDLSQTEDDVSLSDSDIETIEIAGAIRFDRTGRILSENAKAVSIFSGLLRSSDENFSHISIDELLDTKTLELISRQPNAWHRILFSEKGTDTLSGRESSCAIFCRHWEDLGLSLLIALESSDEGQRDSPTLQLILGDRRLAAGGWPHSAHVLVVDSQMFARRIAVESLRRSGCVCHSASNIEEAQRIAADDSDFLVTVIDGEIEQGNLCAALSKLQQSNPESLIVGTARTDLRKRFEEAGVKHFLRKPWLVTDLIELLDRESERPIAAH